MSPQDLLATAIIALAAGFLGRKLIKSFKGESDGACDKCVPGVKSEKKR